MKIEPHIARRIVKNVLVSLFIYALPVVLMFLTFYLTGQRPWEKIEKSKTEVSTSSSKPNR
jgi:preprotein translocase subunit YajC